MDEFLELEKKCKKLQAKKIIKYFMLLIIVSLSIGLYLFMQPKPKSYKAHKETIIKVKSKPIKKDINKTIHKVIEIKKEEPKKVKEVNKTIIKKVVKPIKIPEWNIEFKLDEINITTKVKTNTKIKEIKPKIIEKPKQIFKTQTITFDKALKLATFYYNNDDYESSIKWCKIASNIDNSNEEIWKLYALNLEKLNQKQKAIKVLKTYLKYKESPELQFILQRLEK